MTATWVLRCLVVSANERLIVFEHKYRSFQQWESKSGEPVGIEIKVHDRVVSCIAIGKDGSTFATGPRDKALRLWNAKHGDPKAH